MTTIEEIQTYSCDCGRTTVAVQPPAEHPYGDERPAHCTVCGTYVKHYDLFDAATLGRFMAGVREENDDGS